MGPSALLAVVPQEGGLGAPSTIPGHEVRPRREAWCFLPRCVAHVVTHTGGGWSMVGRAATFSFLPGGASLAKRTGNIHQSETRPLLFFSLL